MMGYVSVDTCSSAILTYYQSIFLQFMARIKGNSLITGNLKGLSMYTMRGSDTVIVRTKGGPSKQTIAKRESCRALRENGSEWSGSSKAGSLLRRALLPLAALADYQVMGSLIALCKQIQLQDVAHEKGCRHVSVRTYKELLGGFNFNRTNTFDNVIRMKINWSIDRVGVTARVVLPAYEPGLQPKCPFGQPLMRFVAVMGVCSDVVYDETSKAYVPADKVLQGYYSTAATEWFPVKKAMPEQNLEPALKSVVGHLTGQDTLVLGIGVEYGTIGSDGLPAAVKYAGCAKILGGE